MNKSFIRQSTVPGFYDIDLGFGQIFGITLKDLELLKNDIENELWNISYANKGETE